MDASNQADIVQITEKLQKKADEKLQQANDAKEHLEEKLNALHSKVGEWKNHGFIPDDYVNTLKALNGLAHANENGTAVRSDHWNPSASQKECSKTNLTSVSFDFIMHMGDWFFIFFQPFPNNCWTLTKPFQWHALFCSDKFLRILQFKAAGTFHRVVVSVIALEKALSLHEEKYPGVKILWKIYWRREEPGGYNSLEVWSYWFSDRGRTVCAWSFVDDFVLVQSFYLLLWVPCSTSSHEFLSYFSFQFLSGAQFAVEEFDW